MATPLDIYVDIFNCVLVKGINSQEQFVIPGLYQGADFTVRIWPVTPIDGGQAPFYAKLDLSGCTMKIALGPRAGSGVIYAASGSGYANALTIVLDAGASTGYFTGEFNLNTTEMNAFIGNNEAVSTYFEIQFGQAGIYRIINQQLVTINSAVIDPSGTPAPTPVTAYLTRDEALALFVQFAGNAAGKTVQLNSPDGTKWRLLGVNNDGSAQDDLS